MKRITALLLALALCCLLIPAVAEEDVSIVGTWYVTHQKIDDADCRVIDPDILTLEVRDDGTLTLVTTLLGGKEIPGTWSVTDSVITLTVEDDPIDVRLENGEMVLGEERTAMYLSLTPPEPLVLPGAVAASTPAVFNGTWIPEAEISASLYVPRNSNLFLSRPVRIEGANVTILPDEEKGITLPQTYESALKDGVLEVDYGSPDRMTLSLREDGSMFMEEVLQGSDGTEYFTTTIYIRDKTADLKFVTAQEWLDAKGECGDCAMLLRIRQALTDVIALGEDETGMINLYSGTDGDPVIEFRNDRQDLTGYWIVISNPKYNDYEGTIEMIDFTVLRLIPGGF